MAPSGAARRNAKGWPEAMVRTVCFHCNGTWAPGWYLISPDLALPNCVWAPPSSAEGGKSCEMRCHPGSWHLPRAGFATSLPRCIPELWKVRGQRGEPSTPVVDIMDGSFLKHEPAHEAPLSRRSLRWRHQPPRGGMRRVGRRRWCARSALPRHGGRGEIITGRGGIKTDIPLQNAQKIHPA